MKILARQMVVAMLGAGATVGAMATHPFVTDDPAVQGEGNHQIELNTDWVHQQDARSRIAAFTYTYGWRDNVDIYVNIPLGLVDPSGVGNVTLGAKWRIVEREADVIALKPELLLPSSTSAEVKALGYARTSYMLTAVLSHGAGRWALNGNAGIGWNRYALPSEQAAHRAAFWRLSSGMSYRATDSLAVIGDIGVAANRDASSRVSPAFALGGLIYSPSKDLDLDIGIKFGMNRAEVDRQLGAGLTVRF